MADELGAELSLDLDSARREIEGLRRDIEDELGRAIDSFSDDYERAVNSLPEIKPDVDSDAVTSELNRAVQSTDAELEVSADERALTSSIDEAVGATQPILEVAVDGDPLSASLIDVVEHTHPEFTPELNTTDIQRALGDLEGAATGLDLGAGFDDAALQGQELADVLGDLDTQSQESGDGLGAVSNVSTTLATAFSAAKGEGRKLISDLAQIRGGFGGVAAGALALGAGFTALFQAGERSLQSVERATVVLGDGAARIENINVGGLSGPLSELAIKAGVSGGALRDAATSAAQVGLSSGKSIPEVTEFANKVNALALRAVALNPALGDAGAVSQRLNTVLARGGRFLARYGIDLTSAEITTRALADSGKTAVRDLTLFERSVAGADIAVEKLGSTLGTDFERGAATTTVRLRSIRAELNAAFASAGKPLVEPTVDSFEALAQAGAATSVALGNLGKAVLPVVAAGLTTIGEAASVVADTINTIGPGAVIAGGALLLLRSRIAGVFTELTVARRSGSLIDAIGGGSELQATGGRLTILKENVKGLWQNLDTLGGRSVIAIGALTGLDQGLQALGTSTEELGIQFITTGAAIGFAFGGPEGAAVGATIGLLAQSFDDLFNAQTDLQKATADTDAQFKKAKASSGDLRAALFSNAETAAGLASAIAGLDENLVKFILNAGAFQALHVDKDLRQAGISIGEVSDFLQQGQAGFGAFVQRMQDAGKISLDVGRTIAENLFGGSLTEKQIDQVADAVRRGSDVALNAEKPFAAFGFRVREVRENLKDAGVAAVLTSSDFAALTSQQQKNVIAIQREAGERTKALVAFKAQQDALRATERAQFDLFASTNHLTPAILEAAKAASRNGNGAIDWAKALGLLDDAARGVIPELGFMSEETAKATGEMGRLSKATDDAAKAIPGLDAALSKGLDTSFFEDLKIPNPVEGQPEIDVGKFLDTSKLLDTLNETATNTKKFFSDIQIIAESGASNVATALLALGPDNLGARVAADLAANQPLFREGMEKAFEGIAQAQIAGEKILGEMRARVDFLSSHLTDTLGERLKAQFGVTDVTALTSGQIKAFLDVYGTGGDKSAEVFVNSFNQEIVASKIAGLSTDPLTDSVANAKTQISGDLGGINDDIDTAMQRANAAIANKAPGAFAPLSDAAAHAAEVATTDIDVAMQQAEAIITAKRDANRRATQFAFDPVNEEVKNATFPVPTTVDEAMLQAQAKIRASQPGFRSEANQAGEVIPAGLGDGITSQQGLIGDAAATAVQQEIDGKQDEAFQHGVNLGSQITYGVAAGIGSDAAARAAQEEIDRQLDDLDAHATDHIQGGSPAMAFAHIGDSIIQGIAVGLKREGAAAAEMAASLDRLQHDPMYAGDPMKEARYSGFGPSPVPPAGMQPIVQVTLDPSMLVPSMDKSVNVYGGINNYGGDADSKGQATMRRLADVQHLRGYG